MELDINQLIEDIKNVASGIVNKDISVLRGFSNRQLHGIATQSALVASGIASGQIDASTRDFFLDQLIELTKNFVNCLVGLLMATIERLWNAIVSVIWQTISRVTNVQLPAFNPL